MRNSFAVPELDRGVDRLVATERARFTAARIVFSSTAVRLKQSRSYSTFSR
jgi:hypothetical protein